MLDGERVSGIDSDLSAGPISLTKAAKLAQNENVAFMGDTKNGPFDIPGNLARNWMCLPANPNGRSNADVLKPWRNGRDLTRRSEGKWIIDFGPSMDKTEAALYETPFEYVYERVKPARERNRNRKVRECWWLHEAPRPIMWKALKGLSKYIATPRVAKHRLFVWCDVRICPDCQLS